MQDRQGTSSGLQYDGPITIAEGGSRYETKWKNREITWSQLTQRLSQTTRTPETIEEYRAMTRTQQDKVKDVGGFVGGGLKGGRRKGGAVAFRSLITLDADFAPPELWDIFTISFGCAACVYSTHKHRPDSPRLRLVIPLSRPVKEDEHSAISRRIAADIGIDYFDDTTYEPERLMFWPSTSRDGEYVFHVQDGPWLNADEVLAQYDDWRDPTFWPVSERAQKERKKLADKQGDPLTKPGMIGAFCRTYTISESIETFLSDVYDPCGTGRWTYKNGSTAGGLVEYEDKFAYSHHGTDPISGQLCNAFDLVRIHLYGALDDETDPSIPTNKRPSFKAMQEFAGADSRVRIELADERQADAALEFGDAPVEEVKDEKTDSWKTELTYTGRKKNELEPTIENAVLILRNDTRLAGRIRLNEFNHKMEITNDLPWRKLSEGRTWSDTDDSSLRFYMEKRWKYSSPGKLLDAVNHVMQQNTFHPVRDYLGGLSWDGLPRLDLLLVDFLGADDSAYTRAVTRKALVAAVARVYEPGIKFDYMLTLHGAQGIGKSMILRKLAGAWFSDSLTTVEGKEAYETLQGYWILELSELSATKKADIEAIKLFLSKQVDSFRVPYGKRTADFPRQCVFIGTTNDTDFLRDRTGNRRYWPVQVGIGPGRPWSSDFDQYHIDQVWAEAVTRWREHELLYLDDPELAKEAVRRQEEATEDSGKFGIVQAYLEKPLPDHWELMDLQERRRWLRGYDFEGNPTTGGKPRVRVCAAEILDECFGGDEKNRGSWNHREINEIMRRMPGWEYEGRKRAGHDYGVQRCYQRVDPWCVPKD
jgi:predicted P-loop ATPase